MPTNAGAVVDSISLVPDCARMNRLFSASAPPAGLLYCSKSDMAQFVSKVTAEKPRAVFYIDDKGIKFNNWEEVMRHFNESSDSNSNQA